MNSKISPRKFFKTVIAIEVLSEDRIPDGLELDQIVQECRDGGYSMRPLKHAVTKINARQAANALSRHGSDPSFFRLNADGTEDEEE